MILPRLGSSEARHAGHIENDRVVYHAVDRSERGHRIFEDAIPGRKHQIGGNQHGAVLVALGTLTNILQISIIPSANSFR